jgi:micrococcal nuclease
MKNNLSLVAVIGLILILLGGVIVSTDWNSLPKFDFAQLGINTDSTNKSSTNKTNKPIENVTDRVEKADVSRVVDGDTLEMSDGRKIRFLNVDTPETVKPNAPVMCYGENAKNKTKSLIENKTVWLNYDRAKQDRYARDLRFIYLNEEDAIKQNIDNSVNAILVKEGLARSVAYAPNKTYAKQFDALMQTAQDNKKGLWKECKEPFIK